MPGSDIITPSGCFLGIENNFSFCSIWGLTKVFTYQKEEHTVLKWIGVSSLTRWSRCWLRLSSLNLIVHDLYFPSFILDSAVPLL